MDFDSFILTLRYLTDLYNFTKLATQSKKQLF